MRYPSSLYWASVCGLLLFSCRDTANRADAYGNFEAEERIVSAEAAGKILSLQVEEGQTLKGGQVVGAIDSAQLVLRREQLQASIRAVVAKSPAIGAQLAVYEKQTASVRQQLATLDREKRRVENLLKSDAATPKQLDDLNAQIEAAQKQLDVIGEQRSASDASLNVQKSGLLAEVLPLQKQIAQLDDQLAKCRIVNPFDGAVLVQYAESGEVTGFGKPLYKVADLTTITLRAYVAGDQLTRVKVGQDVKVYVDGPDGKPQELSGKVRWISPKAEFTPKVVQTKEERVNLVYATKIAVPNADGALKIGMPAEVRF
ncbi:MAG TPA: efflux RND transporter periplasmic adaptor subunit [Saprospiraceae bacterium]|nr:efflux RND transporter periplasmic adaptor subunit [Saprospiraceae bacterium]HND89250.1 efflux RND transporter periplasmic adaptor subunit [Saprospiraceae bacterium]